MQRQAADRRGRTAATKRPELTRRLGAKHAGPADYRNFLNVLAFGGCLLGEHFNSVLAAFGTLAGSVLGFYFGSRK